MSKALQRGVYQHYKGDYYEVMDVATHTETLEEIVIYRALYDNFKLWARPLEKFLADVEHAGIKQPRFKLLTDKNANEFYKIVSQDN